MSDTSSDSGSSENNAYVVAPSSDLAAGLEALNLTKLIEDKCWDRNGPEGFHQRAVAAQYSFSNNAQSVPRSFESRSTASSMALTAFSRTTYGISSNRSLDSPSLDSRSTRSDTASIRTSRADSVTGYKLPEEEEADSVAEDFPCPYPFLNCAAVFEDVTQWSTHCKWHFRGYAPRTLECPFCSKWSVTAKNGSDIWDEQFQHVDSEHAGGGMLDVGKGPSQSLIQQLYTSGAINVVQRKELSQHRRLVGGSNLRSSGRRREEREQRRHRRA